MEVIKTYLKIGLIKVFLLSLASFYGFLIGIKIIYSRIKYGEKYFCNKERALPPPCLQDSGFNHSYIKLKNVKLHVVEAGDKSKPLMLFVHGFPEFWFSWRNQLKHFSKNFWVVALDMRGYGDSDKPKGVSNYMMKHLVEDVVHLVHALGKEKCILVGHDWGGGIAWQTAARATSSSLVQKLIILNAPHPAAFKEKLYRSWKQFFKSWYIFYFQLPYLPEFSRFVNDQNLFDQIWIKSDGSTIPPEEIEAYKYTFPTFESWTAPINYYRAMFSLQTLQTQKASKLQKIAQPTLIIWGDKDHALEPDFPELSAAYCTGVTKIHRVKNGNHFIQNDHPEAVNAAIEKFLA